MGPGAAGGAGAGWEGAGQSGALHPARAAGTAVDPLPSREQLLCHTVPCTRGACAGAPAADDEALRGIFGVPLRSEGRQVCGVVWFGLVWFGLVWARLREAAKRWWLSAAAEGVRAQACRERQRQPAASSRDTARPARYGPCNDSPLTAVEVLGVHNLAVRGLQTGRGAGQGCLLSASETSWCASTRFLSARLLQCPGTLNSASPCIPVIQLQVRAWLVLYR